MQWEAIYTAWDEFIWGIWYTLHLTALGVGLGFMIALPSALALVHKAWFAPAIRAYVYFFRGTPLLVQVFLVYAGLGQFEFIRESWSWAILKSGWWCVVITFALNSGAYGCEILRGALATTGKGELEGAKAVGLSDRQVTWLIHVPSALRRSMPQYSNEVIFMLHGSVFAYLVQIQDILGVGMTINGRIYGVYEGLLSAASLYMIITYTLIYLMSRAERHFLRHLAPANSKTRTRRRGLMPAIR